MCYLSCILYRRARPPIADGRPIRPLRCDVNIEKIGAIAIQRTQSTLKKGCQQVVQVRAKDDANNTFSGLEGVPFKWSIQEGTDVPSGGPACSPSNAAACSVVVPRLLSSDQSRKVASPLRKAMEVDWGLATDQIVLDAVTPGDATVLVKLKDDPAIAAKAWQVKVVSAFNLFHQYCYCCCRCSSEPKLACCLRYRPQCR